MSITALGLGAAPASAAVGCALDGTTLRIVLGADGDRVDIINVSNRLSVYEDSVPISCLNGTPRAETVDQVVVRDISDGGSTRFRIDSAYEMAPGATSAGDLGFNEREIEFDVDLGDGTGDVIDVETGGSAPSAIIAGADGIDFNRKRNIVADVDVTTAGVDRVELYGGGQAGLVSAAGNSVTGPALEIPTGLTARSLEGERKTVLGGDGGDWIERRGDGFMAIESGAGRDEVIVSEDGSSRIALGAGADTFAGDVDDVGSSIVLRGPGGDALTGGLSPERLLGGPGRDLLLGNEARDALIGGGGRDVLDARDGARDERVDCGAGRDRLRSDRRLDPAPRGCESA